MKPDRLPPLDPATLDAAQQAVVRVIEAGPRGAVYGPFVPMLRSPELVQHAQAMGEYLRYRSALSPRLSELAILVASREWDQGVEWAIHAPIALREGVARAVVEAIARWERPSGMAPDEAAVYDFSIELQMNKQVSDATWARAVAALGEKGVVDLAGINGYYTMLAMLMNAANTPAPPCDGAPGLAP